MAIAQPTTQIDPTNGLIAYVQAIKPYHSKILDVLVEYVVNDTVSATVTDKFELTIIEHEPTGDVIHACGFGFVWDPYGDTPSEQLPYASILSIEGDPLNTFTVEMPVQIPVSIVVSSIKANQFAFVQPSNITAVNAQAMTWTVTGDITTSVDVGSIFYISSNHPSANGKYTVASVSYNSGTNRTQVTTVEPISLLATSSGNFNIPVDVNSLPHWPANLAVKLQTTGTMPSPLNSAETYYFTPSKQLGLFNLSRNRYATEFDDIIDITNGGVGELTLVRAEPFVPGEFVQVYGAFENDGEYTINTVEPDGSNFIITVLQRVPESISEPVGNMLYYGSYGDPYCPIAKAPPMHAETYIYERLVFEFDPVPEEPS